MSRLDGLTEIYSLFASLTDEAKKDLQPRLAKIGAAAIQMQESAVPRKTGNLASTLTVAEQLTQLRVKAGLTAIKKGTLSSRGNYYGIMVEYGRHAGAKLVQRRRRVGGKLRLGPGRKKRNEDISTTHMMRWGVIPARPFVHQENKIVSVVDNIMDGFWDSVLSST